MYWFSIKLKKYMDNKIVFIINKSEITAGTRGASLGPEAIKVAARKIGSDLFEKHSSCNVKNVNELLDVPTVYPFAKRIDGLLSVYKHCRTSYKREGDVVVKGDVIATVGNAGVQSTASHLHLEIWKDGLPQDPAIYLLK